MMNGAKPCGLSGVKLTPGPMRTACVLHAVPSPSPHPSPLGRGRIAARPAANLGRFDLPKHWIGFPLSPRERDGVRGNTTQPNPARWTTPGAVKLWESPRQEPGVYRITK